MRTLWQDLRYGARMLMKKPGFTLIAVITLALGIGANTAIFSVVNAVLLQPLPYRAPEELALLRSFYKTTGMPGESVSFADWEDWRAQRQVLADLALFKGWSFTLARGADRKAVRAATVSANFFSLLGVNAWKGRTFLPAEETAGGANVALLSHALWQRAFGADETIVGQTIRLRDPIGADFQPFTIIGILPPEFQFPFRLEKAEIWTTTAGLPAGMLGRGARNFQALARLQSGVSLPAAQAALTTLAERLEAAHPETNRNHGVLLVPARRELIKDVRLTLWLLSGAVGFVLLIACANVANLLLARALARQRELAIRSALGASGWRIARQLLAESLLLALAGGALGFLLAAWCVPALVALSPKTLPRVNPIELNGQALAFTIFVSTLTGVLFGLAPALKVSRPNLIEALKEGGKTASAGAGQYGLRAALVVGEIAVALMLLVGAGLLINSFIRLNRVQLGFDPTNVFTAGFDFSNPNFGRDLGRYPTGAERLAFMQQARERIRHLPGVHSVSFSSSIPFTGGVRSSFEIKGRPWAAKEESPLVGVSAIFPDYLATMGIPLLQGRPFAESDDKRGKAVALVNEAFARRFFPHENPLGRVLTKFGNGDADTPPEFEIVGVVGNVRGSALDQEPEPEIYSNYWQTPWSWTEMVIRTEPRATNLTNAVRRQIDELDPEQTVFDLSSLEAEIAGSILPQRFNLLLLSLLAGVGLLLTLIGIYGVMSYHVAERTHEIGIRVALGAQPRNLLRLVIGQGMKLTLIGVVAGLAGALALTRLMKTLLFEVSATDPLTFASIVLLLLLAGLLACWIPARRAAKVDPMIALRCE